jgi:hypothetical protein
MMCSTPARPGSSTPTLSALCVQLLGDRRGDQGELAVVETVEGDLVR